MKTTLRLELPALPLLHADSRVPFALLDRQHAIQRAGELPLAELAAAVPASRIEGILHPADCVVATVTVPPVSTHRLQAAVAGAVEPMLLGDIESLAVAHGPRMGDGSVTVAWTAREPLARALRLLADCGLPADALIPAPLALPPTDRGWTVLTRDEYVVVRSGAQEGQAWAVDPLATAQADPAVSALLPALEQATPAVVAWIDPPPAAWPDMQGIEYRGLPAASRWQGPAPDWSLALPELQPDRRGHTPWRRPAAWAAAAAAVWIAGLNVHAWQLGREETALRQRMAAQVKAAFPDIPVVLDPLRQAEQRRDALRAAGGEFGSSDFLPLALAASQLLPAASNNVTALRYTPGELRLRLVDDDIGMLEKTEASPAPAKPPQGHGLRRLAGRRGAAASPPSPAPPTVRREIDPAIMQRAVSLGLQIANDDGEWIIRSGGSADPDRAARPPAQGGVQIQQNNPPR